VLVDPDKVNNSSCETLAAEAQLAGVDFIFVGSSLLTGNNLDDCIQIIKQHCGIPVVLFPGSIMQISHHADAILLLSLISGRNAEMLIGKQVIAAPLLKESNLEIISSGIRHHYNTTALYLFAFKCSDLGTGNITIGA